MGKTLNTCKFCDSKTKEDKGMLRFHHCGTMQIQQLGVWRQSDQCKASQQPDFVEDLIDILKQGKQAHDVN
jgi:hypothetical protein